VACGSTPSPVAPSPIPIPPALRRVVVLGDSLAVSPSRDEGFPAELQKAIARQQLPWSVTNAGISGNTTADGLRRVDPLLEPDVGVLVLELGANDGLQGIDVTLVEHNVAAIIELAQSRGTRVLLCGMETPPVHGLGYSVAFHGVFPDLAQRYGLSLVPFLLAGVFLDPDLSGADGVHPNAAGAQRIGETVWPYLQPLLGTSPRGAAREPSLGR